jgi:hypothetical protein
MAVRAKVAKSDVHFFCRPLRKRVTITIATVSMATGGPFHKWRLMRRRKLQSGRGTFHHNAIRGLGLSLIGQHSGRERRFFFRRDMFQNGVKVTVIMSRSHTRGMSDWRSFGGWLGGKRNGACKRIFGTLVEINHWEGRPEEFLHAWDLLRCMMHAKDKWLASSG